MFRGKLVRLLPVAALLAALSPARAALPVARVPAARANPLIPVPAYNRLPLCFVPNRGESGRAVRFLAHGPGYALFLTADGAVFTAPSSARERSVNQILSKRVPAADGPAPQRLTLRLLGMSPHVRLAPVDRLPGTANYLIGNNPRRWQTNLPTYAAVVYHNVYPGIDLRYDGKQGQIETTWIMRPGANVDRIRVAIAGTHLPQVVLGGDLVVPTSAGRFVESRPMAYQEIAGHRRLIPAHYVLGRRGTFRVALGQYDRAQPLLIDPVLQFGTYLGGTGDDGAYGMALDSQGNIYLTGNTTSSNFPLAGPIDSRVNGQDAFVTKLNPTATQILYSTYLGGSGEDTGNSIAVDATGAAYVTGATHSADFPAVHALPTPADCVPNGGIFSPPPGLCSEYKGFVTKLNPAGNGLIFSTLLGGSGGDDISYGIATDAEGDAYVTGLTFSTDFPTTSGAIQSRNRGTTNAFITKFGPAGSLMYSTYLGGSTFAGGSGIAVDTQGDAFIAGYTDSADFPTVNPVQGVLGGNCPGLSVPCPDAIVAELNPTGSTLLFSTFLGGTDADVAGSIALDPGGDMYITGYTQSQNFPTVSAYSSVYGGGSCSDENGSPTQCTDAFVAKISAAHRLVYSTYLGGTGNDSGTGIAVDGAGDAFVTGFTEALNFPLLDPVQSAPPASNCTDSSGNATPCDEAFLTDVAPSGNSLVYSTYLGGAGFTDGYAVALDSADDAYVAGLTSTNPFPALRGLQNANAGGYDAFVVRVGKPATPTPTPVTPTATPTATATPAPTATPKPPRKHIKCKKGHRLVHGKCKKQKKRP